jgi:HD-GYP domain-containing protein (c-di-GMP phosphodiesterase class II)
LTIDPEIADDIICSFDTHYDELQHALNNLGKVPEDADLINVIFRSMHTIKGNAAMAMVQPLVDFTHALEETIDAMRRGDFLPTEKICDLLLISTDHLRDLHQFYLLDKPFDAIDEVAFAARFIDLANSTTSEEAKTKIDLFHQELHPELHPEKNKPDTSIETHINLTDINLAEHQHYVQCVGESSQEQYKDLDYFRELALQVDRQNNFWQGRTDNQVYLAMNLCHLSTEKSVDTVQLLAAIYMHDIGMAFLPYELVNKEAKLDADEFANLQQHVAWGHQLIARMPMWSEAATIVAQHHEKENGTGYPNKLTSEALCEGAKIVAILDAFYAMTNLRSDRTHRRSVLRAISEINACTGTQFNPYWVDLFNQLIKNEVRKGNI